MNSNAPTTTGLLRQGTAFDFLFLGLLVIGFLSGIVGTMYIPLEYLMPVVFIEAIAIGVVVAYRERVRSWVSGRSAAKSSQGLR